MAQKKIAGGITTAADSIDEEGVQDAYTKRIAIIHDQNASKYQTAFDFYLEEITNGFKKNPKVIMTRPLVELVEDEWNVLYFYFIPSLIY